MSTRENKKPSEGSGESTITGYRVEVRCRHFSHRDQFELRDGLIVGPDWRIVHHQQANIPAHKLAMREHELLDYAVAMAIAWDIIAGTGFSSFIECRIVRYTLKTTWALDRDGVVDQPVIVDPVIGRPIVVVPSEFGPLNVDNPT